MEVNKKILLLGNIKEEDSPSMHFYLEDLKKIPSTDFFQPSTSLPKIFFKIFIYPFIIPKNYGVYHIVDHSYSFLINFLPKERTIITCHDLIPLKFQDKMSIEAKILFKFYLTGIKKAKRIIAVSESTKKDLIELLGIPAEKIVVISTPVNLSFLKPMRKDVAKKKLGLTKKIVLLSVGSGFYKNTILILKSINELKNKYPDIFLVKIGKFTDEEKKYIFLNNLKKFVLEAGSLPDKKLNEYYNAGDILTFPSLYEGFGKPVLHAMHMGLPIITSDISSLPEISGNAAIKINPLSENDFIDAVSRVIENKNLRKKMIKEGGRQIKLFSFKKTLTKTKRIYEDL